MRTDIPSAMQTHFETRETTLAWAWRVHPQKKVFVGSPLYFADGDNDETGLTNLIQIAKYNISPNYLLPSYDFNWRLHVNNLSGGGIDLGDVNYQTDPVGQVAENTNNDYCMVYDIDVTEFPAGAKIDYTDRMHVYNATVLFNSIVLLRGYTEANLANIHADGDRLAVQGTLLDSINDTPGASLDGQVVDREISYTLPANNPYKIIRVIVYLEDYDINAGTIQKKIGYSLPRITVDLTYDGTSTGSNSAW